MSIYVGNLSYQVTQDTLSPVFAECGTLKRVQLTTDREIGQLRGFSFVEMGTEAEKAAAISALDGAEWMCSNLKVNKAKSTEDKGSSEYRGGGYGGAGHSHY